MAANIATRLQRTPTLQIWIELSRMTENEDDMMIDNGGDDDGETAFKDVKWTQMIKSFWNRVLSMSILTDSFIA